MSQKIAYVTGGMGGIGTAICQRLAKDGFKVIEAEDGRIAWELLKERVDEIDMVVTDLEMPNMDGYLLRNS